MNAKNLPLKFAFVLLLVVVSVWAVYKKGLRLGIDLRGGYSLVYGIMDNSAEKKRLEKTRDDLKGRLAKEQDEAKCKEIQETIARFNAQIKRLDAGTEEGNLADRMIQILKNRVDPQGLMNLEWRPLGNTRFEVRMPAGDPKTTQARQAYQAALRDLEQGNIEDYQMRRLERAAPEDRAAEIQKLAGGNAELAKRLEALVKAFDARKKALAGTDESAQSKARLAYAEARDAVRKYNVNPARLEAVLKNYVSAVEAGMKDVSKEDLENRQKAYEVGLKEIQAAQPDRVEEIRKVDEKYRDWASGRRYLEDPSDLKRLIAKAGALEFRIAPTPPGGKDSPFTSGAEVDRYVKKLLEPNGPEEMRAANDPYLWFPIAGDVSSFDGLVTGLDNKGKPWVLLYNQPTYMVLNEGPGGWRLSRAYQTTDSRGLPAVGFEFDELGAKRFAQLTSAHKGWRMAILLDDETFSAPTIKEAISSQGIIEMGGRVDPEEVKDLIRTLDAGALPGKLIPEPLAESAFGPSIGEENMRLGIRAGILGMICVAAFMLIYYLLAGLVADVALMLNIILVLGAMSLLNAVFTLPGIAGVILTIGMAVDANVLIFERLREEQAKGQSIRMAVKNAYERAFTAIFDSNLTTLITCLILGWIGTEEVRGFAITLGLGVAFSLFTALVVTRWIFQAMLGAKLLTRPLRMLSVIGVPKINWMGKRHFFWGLSGAMIVMGIASLIWQGRNIWGIEFSAGTQATFQFRDDAVLKGQQPNDRIVRELFSQAAEKGDYTQLAATARVETVFEPRQADNFMARHDTNKDGKIPAREWADQGLSAEAFGLIDLNKDGSLDRSEVEKLPSLTYQLTTTESRVPIIREVAAQAFGDTQRRRPACTFQLVRDDKLKVLGLRLSPTGRTRIEAVPGLDDSDLLADYKDGVMFVIQDVQPPVTENELLDRIRIMRFQSDLDRDFQGLGYNETQVRLISRNAKGQPEFAVLVRPQEPPANWDDFAEKEEKLLTAALHRGEALVATNFDPAIAGEAAQRAVMAIVLSWVAMIAYLWLRFGSIQWGLAAVICLIHDTIIMVGLVAVSGWLYNTFLGRLLLVSSFKIDLAMVAAILTVIGYSVNDTIVVFDRIRENRGKLTTISAATINLSINQTLSRTLLTSGTTFVVVFIMYAWGGLGIRAFNYALLAGIVFGTYSSVAIAAPLLMGFRKALVGRMLGTQPATE